MKKYLKMIVPGIVLLVIGSWWFFIRPKKIEAPVQPARKMEEINKITLSERPFVTLTPREDGKEVNLVIDRVKNATMVEYEMEYQAASLIQGVFGTIDFTTEPVPVSKDLLFGSCSKGKCRYDKGVSGGSLTLRFEGGSAPFALKSDFNLQQMFDRQGKFVSKDSRATLDVGVKGLADKTFVIVSGTMGLPTDIDGEVIAGPYSFLAATSLTLKNATITIQSKDDLTGAKLMFWNGKTLAELKSTVTDGKIAAPVTGLGTFLVVK